MKHLGIEAKIRNSNKKRKCPTKKEIKNTKDIRSSYILGNFKSDSSMEKLFPDNTEFKIPRDTIYFFDVVGANKNIYFLTVSTKNNKTLIIKDI